MNIVLNGKTQEISEGLSILQLLVTMELENKPVVIEHNKTAIFPREYAKVPMKENDHIEIIVIASGG